MIKKVKHKRYISIIKACNLRTRNKSFFGFNSIVVFGLKKIMIEMERMIIRENLP